MVHQQRIGRSCEKEITPSSRLCSPETVFKGRRDSSKDCLEPFKYM